MKKGSQNTSEFCSNQCQIYFFHGAPILVVCEQCHKQFQKKMTEVKQSKHHFCSHSCNGKWSNAHKTHGTRRSKLEVWLEEQLRSRYPDLGFDFNKTDAIDAELDIFIPSLKLAFELNGIFHYEPIFGDKKLASIQSNDKRKFAACIERKISLCILDVSSMKYFKPDKGKKYLEIITDIIDNSGGERRNRTFLPT